MKQGLLLVFIPFVVAQLILKPYAMIRDTCFRLRLINVENLGDLKFRLKEAGDKLVVICFLPRSCPHSLKIAPVVEKLAYQYANSVKFLRVYEDHDDIFMEYSVKSVPTFVFVRKSGQLTRRTGSNIKDIVNVIESVKSEDQILNTANTSHPVERVGLLYDIECYDDMKGRLAEARDKFVVLSFLPSYCPHSYTMIPQVQELAKKHASTTAFLRINEEHEDIYEIFDIQAVPTFVFVKNKKKLLVVSRVNVKQLSATLDSVLSGDYTSTTTTTQKPKSHVIDVKSPKELQERIAAAGDKLVILAFMTKWCSKCKLIDPKIEDMADEYYGQVDFLRIDDDGETKDTYKEYNIQRVPTFVFMRNSKRINQYQGNTYEKIKTRIELQDFLNPV